MKLSFSYVLFVGYGSLRSFTTTANGMALF